VSTNWFLIGFFNEVKVFKNCHFSAHFKCKSIFVNRDVMEIKSSIQLNGYTEHNQRFFIQFGFYEPNILQIKVFICNFF